MKLVNEESIYIGPAFGISSHRHYELQAIVMVAFYQEIKFGEYENQVNNYKVIEEITDGIENPIELFILGKEFGHILTRAEDKAIEDLAVHMQPDYDEDKNIFIQNVTAKLKAVNDGEDMSDIEFTPV